MEDIIDLIATDASASDVSDKIKQALFMKTAEKIENLRPTVSASLFGEPEQDNSSEDTQ